MKIPLNYFTRVSNTLTNTPSALYVAPEKRAGIILTAIGANITNQTQTITLGISSTGISDSYYDLLKEFKIPSYDSANLTVGKVVLKEGDVLIASAQNLNSIDLTLSILEAVNT
jgi:hypothetical protein